MYSGIYLGLFWAIKHFLTIAGSRLTEPSFLAFLLASGTPIFLFHFLKNYKVKILNNSMSYWHGVQFGIMLFFFASILEAMAVFIHITWIDASYLGNLYKNMIEMAKSLNLSESMLGALQKNSPPSPASYIFSNVIMSNVFIGIILSLVIVPIVKRYSPTNKSNVQSNSN